MVNSENLVTTYVLVVWIIEIFMNYHDKDNIFVIVIIVNFWKLMYIKVAGHRFAYANDLNTSSLSTLNRDG